MTEYEDERPGIITLSPHFNDAAALVAASADPAEAARTLAFDLEQYAKALNRKSPDELRQHLESCDEAIFDLVGTGGDFREEVEGIVCKYVEELCDEASSDEYHAGKFQDAIDRLVEEAIDQCVYNGFYY